MKTQVDLGISYRFPKVNPCTNELRSCAGIIRAFVMQFLDSMFASNHEKSLIALFILSVYSSSFPFAKVVPFYG